MAAEKAEKSKKKRGAKANRQIKNTVFCKLFGDEKNAIELVNALLGTKYGPDAKAEITTLENVLYNGVVNDLAILLDDVLLVLIEHQSTICGNMPLRMLEYATETYKRFVNDKNVYAGRQIPLPRPVFMILYNGTEKMDGRGAYRLSDSYAKTSLPAFAGTGGLELEVKAIDVNDPRNKNLVKTCKLLDGYCIFVKELNRNKKTMDPEAAVKKAIDDCIARGVLVDFLKKYRRGLTSMLVKQWNRKDAIRWAKDDGIEEGREEGREEGLAEGREEGRAEGREEGRAEGLKKGLAKGIGIGRKEGVTKTARAMKRGGIAVKNISKFTGLSVEAIKQL